MFRNYSTFSSHVSWCVAAAVCRRIDHGVVSVVAMTAPLFLIDSTRDHMPLSSDDIQVGWSLTLPHEVAHHAISSMRIQTGDALQISDGQGLRIGAVMIDPQAALVRVDDVVREPRVMSRICLIQALAKSGHDEQAIDMATQIGVDEVIPWQSQRSIAKWKQGRSDKRWQQVLRAACEQSRRSWLPTLGPCVVGTNIDAICKRACVHGDLVIALHQDATDSWDSLNAHIDQLLERITVDGNERTIYLAVGPEGGMSDEEIAALKKTGAHVCVMGKNILRSSVAGAVALSLVSQAIGRIR